MSNNFIVTTTSTLEGYEIKSYLGAVSAHVVAGTGLFSDMAAGFRDIFGGRSLSYQKQLSSIKSEVLENLKQEAKKLGANSIVGLTIDFDEISGGGKSMFMVTAMGTATIVNNIGNVKNEETYTMNGDQMEIELKKNEILQDFQNNEFSLEESDWHFLIDNRIIEAIPYLLKKLEEMAESSIEFGGDEFIKKTENLFLNLPSNLIKDYLYQTLKRDKLSKLMLKTICQQELLDLDEVEKMLRDNNLNVRKYAISLLVFNKQTYNKDDIIKLREIICLLKEKFPPVFEKYNKKQLLSSKVNEYWKCTCGRENDEEVCLSCGKNIYGFYVKDYKPEDGIDFAEAKLKILKNAFEKAS